MPFVSRRTVGATASEIFSEDLVLGWFDLGCQKMHPKDAATYASHKFEKLLNRYTGKGEARQLWNAITFSSKEYLWSFPKGRERILYCLKKVRSSSEVTLRPPKEWLRWGELNGKSPNFLIENLRTKSFMNRFLYQEPTPSWEGCFRSLPFSRL